jgi:hypothetical protein
VPTKKQLANLKRGIAAHVAEGFSTRRAIADSFIEDPDEEEYGEVDEKVVAALVDQAVRAHHAKQATWTDPTDCDKLDAAFLALVRQGVVARQHFTCCSNCGHAEIGMEIDAERPKRAVVGYAFYHMQDTQSAVDGGNIYIKYGAVSADRVEREAVALRITDALTAAGLKSRWNGDPDTAIVVKLKWRKRRKDRLPTSSTAVRPVK